MKHNNLLKTRIYIFIRIFYGYISLIVNIIFVKIIEVLLLLNVSKQEYKSN